MVALRVKLECEWLPKITDQKKKAYFDHWSNQSKSIWSDCRSNRLKSIKTFTFFFTFWLTLIGFEWLRSTLSDFNLFDNFILFTLTFPVSLYFTNLQLNPDKLAINKPLLPSLIDLFGIAVAILDCMQKSWQPNCRGENLQESMQNICRKIS